MTTTTPSKAAIALAQSLRLARLIDAEYRPLVEAAEALIRQADHPTQTDPRHLLARLPALRAALAPFTPGGGA